MYGNRLVDVELWTTAQQDEWYKRTHPKLDKTPDEKMRDVVGAEQLRLASVLNSDWLDYGTVRCFRCLYMHPLGGAAVAQVVQRKGLSGFEIGVVRCGEHAQLKAYAMSTLEAVIWSGIWDSPSEISWEIVL